MSNYPISDIRKLFIDYFVKNSHKHIAASSLIPQHDPSLMFVNSGMVQFKDVFTGQEKRDYKRATTAQKSVRAGGKHNDLENVGYTARHHTFFEMLGNFSFGDYFKEEAIYYAWHLLTKEFAIDKNRLYVTVYHNDEEAKRFWRKIANLSDDRIISIATNDNFWSMGDTGPCGPCSEIFYDHGEHILGGLPGSKDQDGDRYVEIWNMVFMQFEQVNSETRIELPQKSIDTGMGLERIGAVLQGVHDNYDIDLFLNIIHQIEEVVSVKQTQENKASFRIIADHLRSCGFLIADGIMPANEGRGYVLRRIMRRSMRHLHILNDKEIVMYKLVPVLADLMSQAYPELKHNETLICNVLQDEEQKFKSTLDRGLSLLTEESNRLKKGGILSGEIAFKLYDTYGFPVDLTQDILHTKNIRVDMDGFNSKMQEQKQLARKNWQGSGDNKISSLWFEVKEQFDNTEFVGYNLDNIHAKVLALIVNDQNVHSVENTEQSFLLLANQTPFYGESGGQVGDVGWITSSNAKIRVVNTLKYLNELHIHVCVLEFGQINVNDLINLEIDVAYRQSLRIHHSATHILHSVLRDVLGEHVSQKGSLVCHNKLRFDFSHTKGLTEEEISLVATKVNAIIRKAINVEVRLMPYNEALKLGAMALFGEKYTEQVRVVTINDNKASYSVELCGGTHVKNTGEIGLFKITTETAVASGIRRIEAVCGEYAIEYFANLESIVFKITDTLKISVGDVLDKLDALLTENKQLNKELLKIKIAKLAINEVERENAIAIANGVFLIHKHTHKEDTKLLRVAIDNSSNLENMVVIYSNIGDKLSVLIYVGKNAQKFWHAGNLAKKISLLIDGNGGGNSSIAQIGGGEVTKLPLLNDNLMLLLN